MSRSSNSANGKPRQRPARRTSKAGRPRRFQKPIEVLPGATLFSDDPDMQDPVWFVRAFKAFPQYMRLLDDARLAPEGGRPRDPGDWPLLYLAYTLSGVTEVRKFWAQWQHSPIWAECGFADRPSYPSIWQRFAELEVEPSGEAFRACARALIRQAVAHDDRVGRWLDYDGTAIQSAARLHHCCPDPDMCGKLQKGRAPKILDKSEISEVNRHRHQTVEDEEEDQGEIPSHTEVRDAGFTFTSAATCIAPGM